LPQIDWKAARVKKNAEPYQATSPSELNWVVMTGIAVAMILYVTVSILKAYSECSPRKLTISRAVYVVRVS